MVADMKGKKVWINLGCGIHLLKGFINIDSAFTRKDLEGKKGIFRDAKIDVGAQFIQADMRKLPFPDNYADYMLSHYSIEHIPLFDVADALKEWHRVLKPTGELYIATLDFDNLASLWLNQASASVPDFDIGVYFDLAQQIYGNQITAGEYHFTPFNRPAMNHLLAVAGFPYWESKLFPQNTPYQPIKGYPKFKNTVQRFGEIHVKARKEIPAGTCSGTIHS
jgi:SAM-dependent methyltransferase